ncbi:MAG: ABC transporter substrate-binding protein [Deltaproteobacteria bacterium]|nr:ABC transporter substrate-binding protein [Deltaproteobacteria bacterium]
MLTLALSLLPGSRLMADQRPWKIISWASPLGPQALSYDYLCGLKAMLSFLNLNGGAGGRTIDIYSQEMDDGLPDFPARLNTVIQQIQPDLAVGGAANARSAATADYFRRTGLVWFGPWTNQSAPYQARDDDPIGLLPAAEDELDGLIAYAARKLGPDGSILFIHYQSESGPRELEFASRAAAGHGIGLIPVPLSASFRNWGDLEKDALGAGAILLWLPTGPAAAIVRTLKNRLPEDTLWMTNSLNSPGLEVTEMTGGLWEGMVFPAVLNPKSQITQAYDAVLHKYGPRGLTLDYQTYLGLAQAQVLARALISAPVTSRSQDLRQSLEEAGTSGTLLHLPQFKTGRPPLGAFYLAVATNNWGWRPADE